VKVATTHPDAETHAMDPNRVGILEAKTNRAKTHRPDPHPRLPMRLHLRALLSDLSVLCQAEWPGLTCLRMQRNE
jgi:hypothetical protein